VGSTGTVLEADLPEAERRRPDVGSTASGAGASRTAGGEGARTTSPTAERLVKRLVAQELILSFVPESRAASVADGNAHQVPADVQQGTVTEPIGGLLEEAHIKLSSLVSDLLGASARRMLQALADGETDSAGSGRPGQLSLARHAGTVARRTRRMPGAQSRVPPAAEDGAEELPLIEKQIGQLDQEMADLLRPYQNQVQRLAEVPGLEVDSRSRSLPKWVPRQRHFLPRETSLHGWAHAPVTMRARE